MKLKTLLFCTIAAPVVDKKYPWMCFPKKQQLFCRQKSCLRHICNFLISNYLLLECDSDDNFQWRDDGAGLQV